LGRLTLKILIPIGALSLIMLLPEDSAIVSSFLYVLLFFFSFFTVLGLSLFVFELKILQKLRWNWIKSTSPVPRSPYFKINYKNIEVSYLWSLNGGGIIFAYEFVHVVAQKIGKVSHVFEYCAGPGFIGFSLLANNLCDRLTLADINPKAVAAIKETIKNNALQDRVTVYQSDCLDTIPENERWDLVVSNPPWYLSPKDGKDIRVCDLESQVHEKFYRDINKFLKPNGTILFIEGKEFTNVNCFRGMIENNGLCIIESFLAVPFLAIFKNLNEYKGFRMGLVIFLRLCLAFREAYFIWAKRENADGSPA